MSVIGVAPRILRTPRIMEGTPEAGNAYRCTSPPSPLRRGVSSRVLRPGHGNMRRRRLRRLQRLQRLQRIRDPEAWSGLGSPVTRDGIAPSPKSTQKLRTPRPKSARGGHRQDRANRGAQQGNPELGVVQSQTVLNGRNARHPAGEHGAEEEKELRRRPAGLTQVLGTMRAAADGDRFGSRNTGQAPLSNDASPRMAG